MRDKDLSLNDGAGKSAKLIGNLSIVADISAKSSDASQPSPPSSDIQQPENNHERCSGTPPTEHGGPAGLEPTRYGDWEFKGRCIDF